MLITVVYDGYVRSLAILLYSVFITKSVAGALELPADLVPVVTLDRLGRRWTLLLAMGLAGLAGIATGLVPVGELYVLHISNSAAYVKVPVAKVRIIYKRSQWPSRARGKSLRVITPCLFERSRVSLCSLQVERDFQPIFWF